MGSIFSSPKPPPPPPPLPPPPPPPPTPVEAANSADNQARQRAAVNATGRESTILTSGQGATDELQTKKKKLGE